MKKCFFLVGCLLGMMLVSSPVRAQGKVVPTLATDEVRCRQWVDSVMSHLSLQERIGQLLMPKVPAVADKATKKQLKEWVRKYKIGGLLFGKGTVEGQATLTNQAQKDAKVPMLMAFDGEWGLSMRLSGVPDFPLNASLGCITDPALVEAYGREVARELRALGVQVNFAPVADVNTNPLNPVINVRSFGENTQSVAAKVLAYGRGLEQGGVLSVAKHFPGHGDTSTDSHRTLPVLGHDRARLDSVELYPFREYVRAGLGGVMVGHLQVSALEADSLLPSSLNDSLSWMWSAVERSACWLFLRDMYLSIAFCSKSYARSNSLDNYFVLSAIRRVRLEVPTLSELAHERLQLRTQFRLFLCTLM